MSSTKPSCEEKIDVCLQERMNQIFNDSGEWNKEEILSIEEKTVYKVCLSWGGPADSFELIWDGEEWAGGRYLFQDWLDGASRELGSETVKRLAQVFRIFPDCG